MENLKELGLGFRPSGFLIDDPLCPPPSVSPSLSNPSPTSISKECWQIAEKNALRIIQLVRPTFVSQQFRKEIVEFLQDLIRSNLGFEVFSFGSVPLKTYLPDGDIDVTVVSPETVEDSLAKKVLAVIERAKNRNDIRFIVTDVQYIDAEVNIIKCLVQNIAVDISFNRLGGLCTLCFLEQVDHLIGKDHLFKRSIILIKTWCHYESRILGSHHGLLSTYALETMVLYMFQIYHSSLDGPLAVLYRFLDYYSKFDWDSYCISLYGPVPIFSLPEIAAETPDNDGGELLLEKEFLRDCSIKFAAPSRGPDSNSFFRKNLNIVDPLKESNSLGKSVNEGNSYRIRNAFTYGARKLGQILLLKVDDVSEELNKFFKNTLERHGSRQSQDVHETSSVNVSTSASFESAAKEDSTENGSQRRPSGGLIPSLEMFDRVGFRKGKSSILACPLVGDSSKLVINPKGCSSGGNGDGSSSSSMLEFDGISLKSTEESVEDFPGLGGDYEKLMNCLERAKKFYDGEPSQQFSASQSSEFHQNNILHQGPHHMYYAANSFHHMNGIYQASHDYHQVRPGTVCAVVGATSTYRGTGTYIPNLSTGDVSYTERYSSGWMRNGPPFPRKFNQYARPHRQSNWVGRYKPPHKILPQSNPTQGNQRLPVVPHGVGLSVEFPLSSTRGSNNKLRRAKAGTSSCSSGSKPDSGPNVEGNKGKEFHLQNEVDFPPLRVAVEEGQSSK